MITFHGAYEDLTDVYLVMELCTGEWVPVRSALRHAPCQTSILSGTFFAGTFLKCFVSPRLTLPPNPLPTSADPPPHPAMPSLPRTTV